MKWKKADVIMIVAVLCAALAGLGYWYLTREEGVRVIVTCGSGSEARVLADLPLDEDAELELEDGAGGTNHLVIRGGAAYVTEANCPDKICVNDYSDGIRYEGETIVCLPHKIVVSIEGGESADLDHIAK